MDTIAKPICFAVMPYGKKPTNAGDDAPAEIDFDRLWQAAFEPVLKDIGYIPVRADEDVGANIIGEMIERLAVSDLVIADVSIANANVYYELGVRHAASPSGCVMLAADWARPVFDLQSMRQIRYPLPEPSVSDADAAKIQAILKEHVPDLATGRSPVHTHLPGYPANFDPRASQFREKLEELAAFQTQIAEVRTKGGFKDHASEMAQEYAGRPIQTSVAIEILMLLRDSKNWPKLLEFAAKLPDSVRQLAFVKEQVALAVSNDGDHLKAIAGIEALIKLEGDSSERQGLLGGRYKRLWSETKKPEYLDRAIRAYENGMYLDLNDYYPICNLPRLYRARNRKGDGDKAVVAASVTAVACERARRRNVKDNWLNQTLLGAAFDAGDANRARELADEIRLDGPTAFHLDTLLPDLEKSLAFASAESADEMRLIFEELQQLAQPAEATTA